MASSQVRWQHFRAWLDVQAVWRTDPVPCSVALSAGERIVDVLITDPNGVPLGYVMHDAIADRVRPDASRQAGAGWHLIQAAYMLAAEAQGLALVERQGKQRPYWDSEHGHRLLAFRPAAPRGRLAVTARIKAEFAGEVDAAYRVVADRLEPARQPGWRERCARASGNPAFSDHLANAIRYCVPPQHARRGGGDDDGEDVGAKSAATALSAAVPGEADAASVAAAPGRGTSHPWERPGQAAFRAGLLAGYRGRCPITLCAVPECLDCHHITPISAQGTDELANGLLLRADVHRLFHVGLISVDVDAGCLV